MNQYHHYSVRHVNAAFVERRIVISAPTRAKAQAMAEKLYGDAWFMSVVKA